MTADQVFWQRVGAVIGVVLCISADMAFSMNWDRDEVLSEQGNIRNDFLSKAGALPTYRDGQPTGAFYHGNCCGFADAYEADDTFVDAAGNTFAVLTCNDQENCKEVPGKEVCGQDEESGNKVCNTVGGKVSRAPGLNVAGPAGEGSAEPRPSQQYRPWMGLHQPERDRSGWASGRPMLGGPSRGVSRTFTLPPSAPSWYPRTNVEAIMGQASLKLRRTANGWVHWCPACEETHSYRVGMEGSPSWSFDGNVDAPSFSPSMLIKWGNWGNDAPEDKAKYDGRVCHYFLTAGKLAYCGDSTHALAGQTVGLPDMPVHLALGDYDGGDGSQ